MEINNNQTEKNVVNTSQALGHRLKSARESKGLSLDDVSKELHILKRHLQALEANDFESLPQMTFAKGFAMNYGRYLGIDGQIISQSFDAQYPEHLRQLHTADINSPLERIDVVQRESRGLVKMSPMLIVGILLVLGVGGLIYKTVSNAHTKSQTPTQTLQDSHLTLEQHLEQQAQGASIGNVNGAGSVVTPLNLQNHATKNGMAKIDVWVKDSTNIHIADATGKVLLQGVQGRGSYSLSGMPPFAVRIDKVSNVSLDINQQPIKLSQYAQNNQANFTLKLP